MAKTLLLHGGQVVSPQLLWGCAEWHPEHGDSSMADRNQEEVTCRRELAASPKAFFNSWRGTRFLLNTWLQAGSTVVRHSCLTPSQRCRTVFYSRWNNLAGKLHGLIHSLLDHLSKDTYYSLLVPHVRQVIMLFLPNALKQREGFSLIQSDPFFPPCVLDYRFPLKANMILLLFQQSVL